MKVVLEKVTNLKLEVITLITKVQIKDTTVKMVNHMVIKENLMIILKKIKLKIIDKMVLMAAVDKDMVDRKLVQHMLMKTVNLVNHFQKEEAPLKMQEKLLILKLLKNTKS